jgi:two-component system, NtrC family, nitrogen regulation response regulator GlnG
MSGIVLLADDDASLRFVLSQALTKEGFTVRATSNVATLSKWARGGEGDVVLSDVYMGEECVFDALPAIRSARPHLPIIVMSAQSTVATALSASNAGAFDYMPKPFDLDVLIAAVRRSLAGGPDASTRASSKKAAKEENLALIGRSPAMQAAFRTIAKAANTDLTVLIEGESGAGKMRVARALHEHSKRARGPFVALSVAGVSAAQVERDLFAPDGAFARARDGVLALQGLDDLSLESQTRLSGLLPAASEEKPDVRLIASARRSLAALTKTGGFRQDLLHRLNVVTIHLPPLRERSEDIADLARTFLLRVKREGLPEKALDASAIDRLCAYAFPGNVRELENILRRATLSAGQVINGADIEAMLEAVRPPAQAPPQSEDMSTAIAQRVAMEFAASSPRPPAAGVYDRLLAEFERPLLTRTLEATRGNQIRAAAVLGINRNTLRKKIRALGIATGAHD